MDEMAKRIQCVLAIAAKRTHTEHRDFKFQDAETDLA